MNARVPASADVLTRIISEARDAISSAPSFDHLRLEQARADGRLLEAMELGALTHEDAQLGINTVCNIAAECNRQMRGRIEAARKAA